MQDRRKWSLMAILLLLGFLLRVAHGADDSCTFVAISSSTGLEDLLLIEEPGALPLLRLDPSAEVKMGAFSDLLWRTSSCVVSVVRGRGGLLAAETLLDKVIDSAIVLLDKNSSRSDHHASSKVPIFGHGHDRVNCIDAHPQRYIALISVH